MQKCVLLEKLHLFMILWDLAPLETRGLIFYIYQYWFIVDFGRILNSSGYLVPL